MERGYYLIAEALDRRLGSRERGLIVRRIADTEHVGPDGQPRPVSRNTLDRWIRSYRQHGLTGLRDGPRSHQGGVRNASALIEEASGSTSRPAETAGRATTNC